MKKDNSNHDLLLLVAKYAIAKLVIGKQAGTLLQKLKLREAVNREYGHLPKNQRPLATCEEEDQTEKKYMNGFVSSIKKHFGDEALKACKDLFAINEQLFGQRKCSPEESRKNQTKLIKEKHLLPEECIEELTNCPNFNFYIGGERDEQFAIFKNILQFDPNKSLHKHYKYADDKVNLAGVAMLIDSPYLVGLLIDKGLNFTPKNVKEDKQKFTPFALSMQNPLSLNALRTLLENVPLTKFDDFNIACTLLYSINEDAFEVTEIMMDAGVSLQPYRDKLSFDTNNPLALLIMVLRSDFEELSATQFKRGVGLVKKMCRLPREQVLPLVKKEDPHTKDSTNIFRDLSACGRNSTDPGDDVLDAVLTSLPPDIVKSGLNTVYPNHDNHTPLTIACQNNDLSKVERLLKAGADPNFPKDKPSAQPYSKSEATGSQVRLLLLEHGARPKKDLPMGWLRMRPLIHELAFGEIAAVEKLLKMQHPTETGNDKFSALRAALNEIVPIISVDDANKKRTNKIFECVLFATKTESIHTQETKLNRALKKLELLLKAGVDPNPAPNAKQTPIIYIAIEKKLTEVIKLLIKYELKVDEDIVSHSIHNPGAISEEDISIFKLLLENIDYKSNNEMWFMFISVSLTYLKNDIFKILLNGYKNSLGKNKYFLDFLYIGYLTDTSEKKKQFQTLAKTFFTEFTFTENNIPSFRNIPHMVFKRKCVQIIEEVSNEKATKKESNRLGLFSHTESKGTSGHSYLTKNLGFTSSEAKEFQKQTAERSDDNDNSETAESTAQQIITWCNNSFDSEHTEILQIENSKAFVFVNFDAMKEEGCPNDIFEKLSTIRQFGEKESRCFRKVRNQHLWPITVNINGEIIKTNVTHESRDASFLDRCLLAPVIQSDEGNVQLYAFVKYVEKGLHTGAAIKASQQSLKYSTVIIDIKNSSLECV